MSKESTAKSSLAFEEFSRTERVQRLRDKFMTTRPNVDIERAVIYDRVFKKSDELTADSFFSWDQYWWVNVSGFGK